MPFKELNFEGVKELLETGKFDEFLNARENLFFEAKLALPFDMKGGYSTNFKLAKYAASFANKSGGYVICGLKAERPNNALDDVVTKLELCKKEDFYDQGQIVDRIHQSTFPSIKVKVEWYPYEKNPKEGVGVIYVPAQEESKKFFHIMIRELEGERIKGEFFGVPIRGDGFTEWAKVEDLHGRTKLGPNDMKELHATLSSQIADLSSQINDLRGISIKPQVSPEDELQKKIDQIV